MHGRLIVWVLLVAMVLVETGRAAHEFWEYHLKTSKKRKAMKERYARKGINPDGSNRPQLKPTGIAAFLYAVRHWGTALGVAAIVMIPTIYHLLDQIFMTKT